MKKRLVSIMAVAGLVSMLGVASLVSAEIDNGKEKITINAQEQHPDVVKSKDKKKVKDFLHRKHQDEFVKGKQANSLFKYTDDWTCGACHHTTKKGDQPGSCLKCKDLDKMLDKVAKNGKKKFENIYHKNCRDACHKKNDKATGKKTAKCKFCHDRK
jgi:hypothetical protein